MKTTRLPMGTKALVFACLLQLAVLPALAADETWQELFNGKDLVGWVPVNDVTFTATEGNLRLVKGMGWLRSEKEYGDFVLECEWRALVPEYDSGIFVRCGAVGKPWPDEGWQVNLRYDRLAGLVKGYKSIVPSETPKLPVNQWVRMRLEVRGTKITLDVNSERAWEFDKLDRERGYIGIQAEDKSFDFRNLRVRVLDAAPTR